MATTAIKQLQKIIGGKIDSFSDGSGMFLSLENNDCSIEFTFDKKGKKLEDIRIFKNVKRVEVDSKLLTRFEK